MMASSPAQVVELLDRAFKEGDLGTVLSFYDDQAVVVMEPGKLASGIGELRSFFRWAHAIRLFGETI